MAKSTTTTTTTKPATTTTAATVAATAPAGTPTANLPATPGGWVLYQHNGTPVANPAAPNANWVLVANPLPPGVAPHPAKPGTVYAACMAAMGTQGCTVAAMQAAVNALGLRQAHTVASPRGILARMATQYGVGTYCSNGVVRVGAPPAPVPAAK